MLYGSKPLRDAYSSVVKLYESFVGPIHVRAMSRLLGYQGIAMILEQLLLVTEAQVQCVTAVGSEMIYIIASFKPNPAPPPPKEEVCGVVNEQSCVVAPWIRGVVGS